MLGKWENSMEKLPRLSFYFQCIHRSQMKGNQADSTVIDFVVHRQRLVSEYTKKTCL